jgi:hypothetical protein
MEGFSLQRKDQPGMGIQDMTTATKISLGAAALAMAGSTLVAPAIAQAADAEDCATGNTLECLFTTNAGVDLVALATAGDTPTNPLIQNDIIWLGAQNAAFWNDADTVQVWTFSPLSIFPFLEGTGIDTWWNSQTNQSCFLGITTSIGGPYAEPGQFSHAFNRKGCNVGWTV